MTLGSRLLAIAALSLAITCGARAETYPNRLVTIVVPYAPGGATDIVARTLADQFSKMFNQSFIVANKPGAFGLTAMQEIVRQNPDGYNMYVGNVSTNAITPLLFSKKMPFKYDESLQLVAKLAEIPGVLVSTTVNFEPKTFAELVEYAKKNPGKLNYASPGIGSYPHYDTEMLNRAAGIEVLHIPLKGGASEMVTSLISGETQYGFVNVATAESMMKAGRLRALAVVAPERLKNLPNVPTMAEVGYPNIGTLQWQALYVRAGTPAPIVNTLFKAATDVMRSEQTARSLEPAGVVLSPSKSPQQAAEWQNGEFAKWRAITSEIKVDLD
ncbi:tripartite tricarboxylate transporter substrate binding protein [Aquabacter sp. CN5-332]|uniref:Bug family tripartite tricarboxylate transporter substrate binding protein n=1 Tax=Aquabacter sp. CN5-332 TaxID=3156608 RepID=UPI0032B40394